LDRLAAPASNAAPYNQGKSGSILCAAPLNKVVAAMPWPLWKQPRSRTPIVVVDDNYDANAALSRLLEKSGFDIAGRAYDGLSGLNIIKNTHPDVAILDIAMPVLDGYGLARRIGSEIDPSPRLVALTGFGKESDSAEATEAGFDAYLRKPAAWPALKKAVEGTVAS
jgi:CheY-like chemotaxis protein